MHAARFLRSLTAAAGLTTLVTFAVAPASAATHPAKRAAVHTHPVIFVPGTITAPHVTGSTSHSRNWAGYAALPAHSGSSFRYVQATFTVPSVNCAKTVNAVVVHWVGLDGFASGTVEQDGIEADCNGTTPVYTAWWETYPANQIQTVSAVHVGPGDAVTASVYFNRTAGARHDKYNLVLTDVTNGESFNVWKPCGGSSCKNNSAEVISEAPSAADVLPLADYGIISFVNVRVTDKSRQKGGISSANWKHGKIIQVSASGKQTLATPGPLIGSNAFSNTWKRES